MKQSQRNPYSSEQSRCRAVHCFATDLRDEHLQRPGGVLYGNDGAPRFGHGLRPQVHQRLLLLASARAAQLLLRLRDRLGGIQGLEFGILGFDGLTVSGFWGRRFQG